MSEQKKRKTDRRTVYTRRTIREAFISLLRVMPLERISVAELCRIAEINRSTFYLHYASEVSVFKELEDEVFAQFKEFLDQFFTAPGDTFANSTALMRSLNENELFHLITKDRSSQLMERAAESAKTLLVAQLLATGKMTQREAELFAVYTVNGGIAVFMNLIRNGGDNLEEENKYVDRLINGMSP